MKSWIEWLIVLEVLLAVLLLLMMERRKKVELNGVDRSYLCLRGGRASANIVVTTTSFYLSLPSNFPRFRSGMSTSCSPSIANRPGSPPPGVLVGQFGEFTQRGDSRDRRRRELATCAHPCRYPACEGIMRSWNFKSCLISNWDTLIFPVWNF